MHERLSVHNVTFLGASLSELQKYWRAIGLRRLSILDFQLAEPGLTALINDGYSIEAVCHIFGGGDELLRVVDAAAGLGARTVYMLTGGRGGRTWEQAADEFCSAIEPCVRAADSAGVGLAIENASALYADIHIAHTLRDTITLAEMAGIGICVDLFHCWAEAGFASLLDRALPRTRLIQLSDYVLGDRALPGRAVPGDGTIAIQSFLAQVIGRGYAHGFDLELIGPRIEHEGRFEAASRACDVITAMLDGLGA
jgi:sugar phosphate isomerase/epimerase